MALFVAVAVVAVVILGLLLNRYVFKGRSPDQPLDVGPTGNRTASVTDQPEFQPPRDVDGSPWGA